MEVIPAQIEFRYPADCNMLDGSVTRTLMARAYGRVNYEKSAFQDHGPGGIVVNGVEYFCETVYLSSTDNQGIYLLTISQYGSRFPNLNKGEAPILGVTCLIQESPDMTWRPLQAMLTDPDQNFEQFIGWNQRSPLPVHLAVLSEIYKAGMLNPTGD